MPFIFSHEGKIIHRCGGKAINVEQYKKLFSLPDNVEVKEISLEEFIAVPMDGDHHGKLPMSAGERIHALRKDHAALMGWLETQHGIPKGQLATLIRGGESK